MFGPSVSDSQIPPRPCVVRIPAGFVGNRIKILGSSLYLPFFLPFFFFSLFPLPRMLCPLLALHESALEAQLSPHVGNPLQSPQNWGF